MARAVAHRRNTEPRYSDPTALALLPDADRAKVVFVSDESYVPKEFRARMRVRYMRALASMMIPRTVSIDDAVRAAQSPQVVILGAGLDGRAWRMPELKDAIVFEVDHPDSQREKRARVERGQLKAEAKEVRFVPVDFKHDSLDAALLGAGHDPLLPTTWIWEGVVMYLTRDEIDDTLRVISSRSAVTSTLAILYHRPALQLIIVKMFLRRLGEPLRSSFHPPAMRELLARHKFRVTRDGTMTELAQMCGLRDLEIGRKRAHIRAVFATRD